MSLFLKIAKYSLLILFLKSHSVFSERAKDDLNLPTKQMQVQENNTNAQHREKKNKNIQQITYQYAQIATETELNEENENNGSSENGLIYHTFDHGAAFYYRQRVAVFFQNLLIHISQIRLYILFHAWKFLCLNYIF